MLDLFQTGVAGLTWGSVMMLIIGGGLIYLGIARKMEPLLLVPIGFAIILVNLPFGDLMQMVDGEPVATTDNRLTHEFMYLSLDLEEGDTRDDDGERIELPTQATEGEIG